MNVLGQRSSITRRIYVFCIAVCRENAFGLQVYLSAVP